MFLGHRRWEPWRMTFDELHQLGLTAPLIRDQLLELEGERALALDTGVAEIDAYLADLRQEIAIWRELYVLSAVTEIATLRAEVDGPQVG
jgi:hypothetical protein